MKRISRYFIILLVVLITAVSMSNLQPVKLNFLMFSLEMPVVLFGGIMLLAGFVSGYLVKGIADYRKKEKE